MKNLNEYIVYIGYPFFLENKKYHGFAESAEAAAEIVFRKVSTRPMHSISEYTGIKHYDERCFEVSFGYNENAAVYVKEI